MYERTHEQQARVLYNVRVQELSRPPQGRLISVIIPVENSAFALREQLPRVLSQQCNDSVGIVADNSGSVDDAVSVLDDVGATVLSIELRTS